MKVKVEVFIPKEFVERLMNGINEGGYIREGEYDFAYSSTRVRGHWRPLENANPFSGAVGEISSEWEEKVEFRVKEEHISDVYEIILREHPYEVPVVNFIPLLEDFNNK